MKFHFGSFVVHFHFELSLLFVSSIRLHLSNSLHSPFGFHLIRRPHFNQNKSSFTIILLSFNGFQKPKVAGSNISRFINHCSNEWLVSNEFVIERSCAKVGPIGQYYLLDLQKHFVED
ncbi:uncharacterized protein LOC111241699 isoform X1 [Vigna radiata var. radiata]|uniref:Uncharacterized protein LOC111241699 isoform X1 n=1 Tax=Vigna radiata var. radiata TaxID=3916 RepID=A0A3Q0EZ45_VIGRR|nr:uncharacterized protein LOC111241699 isoform X1 [Vigna radiata var. radiata]